MRVKLKNASIIPKITPFIKCFVKILITVLKMRTIPKNLALILWQPHSNSFDIQEPFVKHGITADRPDLIICLLIAVDK